MANRRIVGGPSRPIDFVNAQGVRIDPIMSTLEVVDSAHSELHRGDMFVVSGQATLANAANQDILVTTPDTDKWAHMDVYTRMSLEGSISIYEAPTITGNGTPVTAYNRNRNSANAATTLVYTGPTNSGLGTLIFVTHLRSGRQVGAEARDLSEFILKRNTKYLIRLNSEAASNDVSWILNWYEHSNGE